MKLKNLKSICAAVFFGLLATSCGINTIEIDGGPDSPVTPGRPGVVNGQMVDYTIWGTITDSDGKPLSGVNVCSGEAAATSDKAGFFTLARIDDNRGRCIVKFEKEGYFPVVRSCEIGSYTDYGWDVAMKSTSGANTATKRFSARYETTLQAGAMTVKFPADCYLVASTGEKYSGIVNAEAYYLSPDVENFASVMPGGDMAAVDASGNSRILMSYGMLSVQLADDEGRALQLDGASEAEISAPVPASMKTGAPASMPLWSFDEATGLWKEEGVANLTSDGRYTGTVTHFSWWNFDVDYAISWIEGTVTNKSGVPLSGIKIIINNQITVKTDASGHYQSRVLSNYGFGVVVPSETYAGYTPEYRSTVGPIAPGMTLRHDIVLPDLHCVYGEVVDRHDRPVVGAYRIEYVGSSARWYDTDKDGRFRYYLTPGLKGDAEVSVVSNAGAIDAHRFYIPGDEDVYLRLQLSDASAIVPDLPDIIADCGNGSIHYLNASRPGNDVFGGVVVEDSWLTVISDFMAMETELGNMFILQVPGYSPEKTTYDSFSFAAIDEMKVVQCVSGNLTIKEENDIYYFSLSGPGVFATMTDNGDLTGVSSASVVVNDVGISHLMTLERREDYMPAEPFRADVPHLSVPAPVAMVITKSKKIGTGGFLYYNGTMQDFDVLLAQADHTGYKKVMVDKEQDYLAEALFTEGNSIIMLDADKHIPAITSASWRNVPMFMFEDNDDDYPYESQVSVTMWNGGTLPLDFILNEYSRASIGRKIMNLKRAFPLQLPHADN